MCKHLPVFVVHLKQVFVIVAAAGDGYTLFWKLSLDLVYPELLKSPNGQIFHWERSGATKGQLQIPHPCEFEDHLQHRGVCEADGQVAVVGVFFHFRRQHCFAVAHQVCQAVIAVTDSHGTAAVVNCVSLSENQRVVLLTSHKTDVYAKEAGQNESQTKGESRVGYCLHQHWCQAAKCLLLLLCD